MPGSTPLISRSSQSNSSALGSFVRIVCAVAYLVAILMSLPLWSDNRLYPKAALFAQFTPAPIVSVGMVLVFIGSLLSLLFFTRARNLFIALQFLAFSLLAIADQSRLQPWAYLYSLILLLQIPKTDDRKYRAMLCWIFAAVYFWSGIHKLNVSFIFQIFPLVMGNFMSAIPPEMLPEAAITAVLFEAGAGLLLLVPCYQRIAAIFLMLMHAMILVCLGPFGRSFNSVIWPWNIAMMLLLARIFVFSAPALPALHPRNFSALNLVVWTLFVIMPAFSFVDRWDSYLSFALYSPDVVYGELRLDEGEREKLAPPLRRLAIALTGTTTVALPFNAWSYGELNVPTIPEPRVYRALARSVCRQYIGIKSLRLVLRSKPHWKTAETTESSTSCEELGIVRGAHNP